MHKTLEMEERGIQALKMLRLSSLRKGENFLIFDDRLPPEHFYLEYPDGTIEMVTFSKKRNEYSVREILGTRQSELLRKKYGFCPFHS
jgi:hypothetical protein